MLEELNFTASSSKKEITPNEYIYLMFEHTNVEDGILYFPWSKNIGYKNIVVTYKTEMNWNLTECEKTMAEFNELYSNLEKIASVYEVITDNPCENKDIFNNEKVFNTWNTFIRTFDTSEYNFDMIREIEDKLETIRELKEISKKIVEEQILDETEKVFLKQALDIDVTEEEKEIYNKYQSIINEESEKRVGTNIFARCFVITANRLCMLMHLGAPQFILDSEARQLASALVVHKYGKYMEETDDFHCSTSDFFYEYDADSDEFYRPKKKNTRKSLVPLYIYFVLKEYTNSQKHLSDNEFLSILKEKYDIDISRNTLSRHVYNLADEGLSIFSIKGQGKWMEQETT